MNQQAIDESDVLIIGGGLAGLSAAEALSRQSLSDGRELRVTVLESKRRLGGRAGSFLDPESGDEIDYCQHVAMGCCTNFIDLMNCCELQHQFRRDRSLTFLHPDFEPSLFSPSRWLPPPFHLLPTIGSLRFLDRRQRKEIRQAIWKLMRTPSASLTGVLAARWLNESGQSQDTIKAFWDVIFVSALGEQTDRVSMAAARKVMIDGFAGARGASDVLVPKMPLSQLFGARLVDHLRNRGVRILTGQSVRRVTVDRQVETSQSQHTAKAVICAVPWYFANTLFQDWSSTARRDLPELESFSHFPSSPITGIHLWFDQPITDENHSVMVGTLSQWVFREPWEQSNQTETVASESTGRNEFYFQVVISASAGLKRLEREDLISQILSELRHAFPNTRDAKLLRYKVVTDPKAVFSVQPEVESERPEQSTGVPWLQLAGDWTRTDWPATMEGAVISGRRAAAGVYSVFTGKNGKIGAMSFLRDGLPRGMLARCLIRN